MAYLLFVFNITTIDLQNVVLDFLYNSNFKAEKAGDLLTIDVRPQSENFAVDTRSESVQV